MPQRAPRACVVPGCPELIRDGSRCPAHRRPDTRPPRFKYGGTKWRRIRAQFLKKHPICICADLACGVPHPGPCRQPATVADHIVRRRDGGSDKHANLQALCGPCHSSKTVRLDGGFGRVST